MGQNTSYNLNSITISGTNNTALGFNALNNTTTGAANTANGTNALRSNTTGSGNTANGSQSLFSNTTGSGNTANGYQSLYNTTTGAETPPMVISLFTTPLRGATTPPMDFLRFTPTPQGATTPYRCRNTSTSGSLVSGSFATKVDFGTGERPYSVAIGDVDGDGKPDLAVANASSNTVSVLRNTATNGSITASSFATNVDFGTGTGPYSVAIGDVDGDGRPDLAVANNGSGTVSVLRNTATSGSITASSFAPNVDFGTGANSYSVAIGDLDGDGKPDLAVANNGSNNVSVLRNANIIYTFTGSGNWNNAANWAGNIAPPSTLPANVQILINPTGSAECILNVPVTVPKSSSITVAPGKRFVIQENLTITQ